MTPQLSTRYVFTITVRIGEVTSAGEIGTGVPLIYHLSADSTVASKLDLAA